MKKIKKIIAKADIDNYTLHAITFVAGEAAVLGAIRSTNAKLRVFLFIVSVFLYIIDMELFY